MWDAESSVCWMENNLLGCWKPIKACEVCPLCGADVVADGGPCGAHSAKMKPYAGLFSPLQRDYHCRGFSSVKMYVYHLFVAHLVYRNTSNTSRCIWSHPRAWIWACNWACNKWANTEKPHKHQRRDSEGPFKVLSEVKTNTFYVHKPADLHNGWKYSGRH